MNDIVIGIGICILWVVLPLAVLLVLTAGRAERREAERDRAQRDLKKALRSLAAHEQFSRECEAAIRQAIAVATASGVPFEFIDLTDLQHAETVEDAFPGHTEGNQS